MGYITDFTMKALTLRKNLQVSIEIHNEIQDYLTAPADGTSYFQSLEWSDFNRYWHLSGKWYDHDEEMKTISVAFPDVVFQLEGMGEDADEKWRTYYWNGNMSEATVVTNYSECPW